MRKIVLHEFGGPEVLVVRDVPKPVPAADGYVVEARAAGLNYADVVERRGLYTKNPTLPCDIGKEASGVIAARGKEATEFEVGDTVCVARLVNSGCYAEFIPASSTEVLPPPAGFSFDELAAFPNTFATAWYVLTENARVRPGESVLIQAAAGGVGTATVALARSLGCSPILGTAGGPEKCAWVESLGADACIDYTAVDFRDAVREHTGGRGVDVVLESVGGEVFDRSLELLAPLGRIVVIGFSSIDGDYAERIQRVHPLTVFHRSISLAGLNVANLDYAARRDTWHALVAHVEEHGLRPEIGHRFALEEAPAAHRALESRATRGKVLLTL